MTKTKETGPLHEMPLDLEKAIKSQKAASSAWENITPLAQNEWICWVSSAKKSETRKARIERTKKRARGSKPTCPFHKELLN